MPDEASITVRGIEGGRRFEPEALSVPAARQYVASTLAQEGFSGDTETVLLLVSELATNVVRHAVTPYEIGVDVHGAGVQVVVVDEDAAHPPEMRSPTPEDTSGRGLIIVDRLATNWGSNR